MSYYYPVIPFYHLKANLALKTTIKFGIDHY
jgi:hypothetical protein